MILSYTLVFAGALLLTPFMVHALLGVGLTSVVSTVNTLGIGPVAVGMTRGRHLLGRGAEASKVVYNAGHTGAMKVTEKYFPKAHRYVKMLQPRCRKGRFSRRQKMIPGRRRHEIHGSMG